MTMHWLLQTILATTAVLGSAKPVDASQENRPVASGQLVKLTIGLHPESHNHFERTLYEISNPYHQNYGKHLTREQAKALLQPPLRATNSVKRWLLDQGVQEADVEDRGSFLHVHVPSKKAESFLAAIPQPSKRRSANPADRDAQPIPEHVLQHISTIHPAAVFGGSVNLNKKRWNVPQPNSMSRRSSGLGFGKRPEKSDKEVDLEKCKEELTPTCIRESYNMGHDNAMPHPKALYGVPGFSGQTAQFAELEEFVARFAPFAAGANFSVELVNGGENPQGDYPSGEANLDIQYAVAMSFNISVQYIAVGGAYRDFIPDLDIADPKEAAVEPFLEMASYLLDLPDDEMPQVISISYGINEQVLPESYARQVCDMFGQLGTRGVSVVTSGGNTGPGVSCQANDGTNSTRFLPMFPASCPYVTAVGATEGNSPEVATNFSSGGFSNYFARPAWQEDVVAAYLHAHGDEWKGYYNSSGRASPDVASFGWGHQVMNHGEVETTGGTSAASPVFAAMIALINNERFKKGRPAMGFLNPWIYSIGEVAFTDIAEGKSIGCTGESIWGLPSPYVPDAGWSAVEGWDPITGFGTPLYDRLKRLACD